MSDPIFYDDRLYDSDLILDFIENDDRRDDDFEDFEDYDPLWDVDADNEASLPF